MVFVAGRPVSHRRAAGRTEIPAEPFGIAQKKNAAVT
jgi:hypothetical protein